MKRTYLFFMIFFTCQMVSFGQYTSGISTGYGTYSANLNLGKNDGLYQGGDGEGYSLIVQNLSLGTNDGLYKGGSGIGYLSLSQNLNLGTSDGFYQGGAGIGHNTLVAKYIRLSRCNDAQLVWNGNDTVGWANAANWDCGTAPVATSIVTIPTSPKRWPIVNTNATIKALNMQSGAVIYLPNTNKLTVTGL
jgi:hypothetical protein